jgi:hypothetical protein
MTDDTSRIVRYQICQIDSVKRTVVVKTSLPLAEVLSGKLKCPLFPRHPIILEDISPAKGAQSQYIVSFRQLTPHQYYPPIYPVWRDASFVLPLWSLLIAPGDNRVLKVAVSLNRRVGAPEGIRLIFPSGPIPLEKAMGFCLMGGFLSRRIHLEKTPVTMYVPHRGVQNYLQTLTELVLPVICRFFGFWIWRDLHLIYEEQSPRLSKQKAMLFSYGSKGLGRFIFQSLEPADHWERLTQMDLIAHEIMHYYLDTTEPAGSWLVEGLTTYVTRKLLLETGLYSQDDWLAWVDRAYQECLDNPLCHKTSLATTYRRFWNPRYANVIYNKGFLVACLLDRDLGGILPALGRDLFQEKVSYNDQFRREEFEAKLPDAARRLLRRLLRQRDLTEEFRSLAGRDRTALCKA